MTTNLQTLKLELWTSTIHLKCINLKRKHGYCYQLWGKWISIGEDTIHFWNVLKTCYGINYRCSCRSSCHACITVMKVLTATWFVGHVVQERRKVKQLRLKFSVNLILFYLASPATTLKLLSSSIQYNKFILSYSSEINVKIV